jgi:hypothetical protein
MNILVSYEPYWTNFVKSAKPYLVLLASFSVQFFSDCYKILIFCVYKILACCLIMIQFDLPISNEILACLMKLKHLLLH